MRFDAAIPNTTFSRYQFHQYNIMSDILKNRHLFILDATYIPWRFGNEMLQFDILYGNVTGQNVCIFEYMYIIK